MTFDNLNKRLSALRQATANDDAVAQKPVVVIVDDDEQVLSALRLVLRRSYRVETSSNPVEGVLVACKPDVSLVILDVIMPLHDGFWVFEEIRKRNTKVPIIFNSAHQGIKTAEELKAMGAIFLSKTENPAVFLETISKVLATARV